jgi:hypothetical protein
VRKVTSAATRGVIAISGRFAPVLAKHTKHLSLVDTQEALTAQWGSR